MKWLTIEWIRKHSRIDFDIEDDLLELYGESAEESVLNLCNRSYEDIVETWNGVPKAIMHASLMLVEVSYRFRSPDTISRLYAVPYTFEMLIKPYMRLADVSSGGGGSVTGALMDCYGALLADVEGRLLCGA